VLAFGIAMTAKGDIGYNQFWIIFGLVAWALSAGTGILFLEPESKRLNKAAAAHGPEAPEVQARLSRILLVIRVDVALMMLIVFDMVVKTLQLAVPRRRLAGPPSERAGSARASV
jgi:uncharacterized membrane protein